MDSVKTIPAIGVVDGPTSLVQDTTFYSRSGTGVTLRKGSKLEPVERVKIEYGVNFAIPDFKAFGTHPK